MDRYLVVGVETVAGANLAAHLAQCGCDVAGQSTDSSVVIAGCHMLRTSGIEAACQEASEALGGLEHVIFCGPAARSSWELPASAITKSLVEQTAGWAQAASQAGARFTLISSDAVFTGPWMFHDEEGGGLCESAAAGILREAERRALEVDPHALIVRTNVFGWSPVGERGWIEQRLTELRTRRLADQDFIRHATPILATDLAQILQRAWEEGLTGVHHVAGAERVSPLKFVQRLAEQFQQPWLSLRRSEALMERATGFGAGECSLQTKRIRKAICVAMPMLSEGLARLAEQNENGFRGRLTTLSPAVNQRVA